MFSYYTAGESHGPQVTAIIKTLPAGLAIDIEKINEQLMRRQGGYGRGGRMEIETDKIEIKSGLRHGLTIGSPLTLIVKNKDWENWREVMAIEGDKESSNDREKVTRPRPGHADLAGAIKYNFSDIRNVLERASARETAARTAVGSVCRQFLSQFGIKIYSHVTRIGEVESPKYDGEESSEDFFAAVEASDLRCRSKKKEKEMKEMIDRWRERGESAGGVFELIIAGVPPGLGSHVHWDEKLEAKLSGAMMSIQAIKGVEIGAGFGGAALPGSKFHDEIHRDEENGLYRCSNNAGGFEGGMTNGEIIRVKAAMKPIPTLAQPLSTFDIETGAPAEAARERADICAVPSASIVGEAVAAIEIAQSFADKFSGDHMEDIVASYNNYRKRISDKFLEPSPE